MSVFDHPRVSRLLEELREAHILAERLKSQRQSSVDIAAVIDGLHRALGAQIEHLAPRPAPRVASLPDAVTPAPAPVREQVSYASPKEEEPQTESWYTEEIEVDGPLFAPGDLGDPDFTDVPESEVLVEEASKPPEERVVCRGDDWYKAEVDMELVNIEELLKLIGEPVALTKEDAAAIHIEANRVGWLCSEGVHMLDGHRPVVSSVVLAFSAARVKHLASVLEDDLPARLALEELRRYRLNRELPVVANLVVNSEPEGESWLDDARFWWSQLS